MTSWSEETERETFPSGSHLRLALNFWGMPPPWSSGNLKSRTTRVRSHSQTQCEGPVVLQTFSVVPLWMTGHEDPSQPHQQRHHQVDRHPRVEDAVLEAQRPAGQRGDLLHCVRWIRSHEGQIFFTTRWSWGTSTGWFCRWSSVDSGWEPGLRNTLRETRERPASDLALMIGGVTTYLKVLTDRRRPGPQGPGWENLSAPRSPWQG